MAFSIGTLTAYVKENEDLLLTKSIFEADTVKLILSESTVMTGVKYKEKINLMATDAIFQDGTVCTSTSSGTTTLTQREVTVGNIMVVEDLCIENLNTVYMSKRLKAGAWNNTMPFEQEYADEKAKTIAKQLEIAVWQGDTSSGNANLSRFDGLLKTLDAAGTATAANSSTYIASGAPISSGTGITTGNVKAIVNAMWLALPADIQGYDDIRIFAGWDTFYKFINAFTDQNLFNFAPTGSEVMNPSGEVKIPGTNYKLTAVHGLDSTNRLIATRMYNIVAATDLESDLDKWEMMPDTYNENLRFKAKFRFGANWAFPDQVVSFKLT